MAKLTHKQQIRALLNAAIKEEKNYDKVRSLYYKASKARDDGWKTLDGARMKLARFACPFKQGQIVKHWKDGFVKITEISYMRAGEIKAPYFEIFGRRLKSDLKIFKEVKVRQFLAEDLEVVEKAVAI